MVLAGGLVHQDAPALLDPPELERGESDDLRHDKGADDDEARAGEVETAERVPRLTLEAKLVHEQLRELDVTHEERDDTNRPVIVML